MHLIARSFLISEFKTYIENLIFTGWRPSFAVVHNTSVPDEQLYTSWHSRASWTMEQWINNLASYYAGMGWSGGPHLIVGYDRIGILNDLRYPGTHSPSWNKISWGIETVGEFEREPFTNGVRNNLIAALGILHSRIGLDPSTIRFHKEDRLTTHKTCPGRNLVKFNLISDVENYMRDDEGQGSIHDISMAVHTADTSTLSRDELFSVKWVQQQLNLKGFSLTVDGIIGTKTKEAVGEFQKSHNLRVDGIAGPVTRLALKNS